MATKTKRKRKPVATTYQTYVLRIDDWQPSYSYALKGHKLDLDPTWEHLEVTIRGTLLGPDSLKDRVLTAIVLGSRRDQRELENPPDPDTEHLCVGMITVREETDYLGSIPHDSLWGLVGALAAGAIKYMDFYGEPIRRSRARIRSVQFARELNLELLE